MLVLVVSIGLAIVLASDAVVRLTRWIVEPNVSWMLKHAARDTAPAPPVAPTVEDAPTVDPPLESPDGLGSHYGTGQAVDTAGLPLVPSRRPASSTTARRASHHRH